MAGRAFNQFFTGSNVSPFRVAINPLASIRGRLLTLAIEIENHFRLRIEPAEEAGVRTLGDLVAIVQGKLADAAG